MHLVFELTISLRPRVFFCFLTNIYVLTLLCVSVRFTNVALQEQYKFVYDTLEEYIRCGITYSAVRELTDTLKQKSIRRDGGKFNTYEKEYMVGSRFKMCLILPNSILSLHMRKNVYARTTCIHK